MRLPSFPGERKRGSRGEEVRLIQEWLCLRDAATAIDGDYGPATARAVAVFQAGAGLAPAGVVDRATFEALIAPMRRAVEPIEPGARSLGELIVAYARQHLEQRPREIGGHNRGPWVRLYMDGIDGPQALWCAGFACSILQQACASLGEEMPIPRSVSCDVLAASARLANRFLPERDRASATISPGSFFLVRKTASDWVHVGIVTRAGEDEMETIEGNTNDEGSREGYEVCARHRGYGGKDFILF